MNTDPPSALSASDAEPPPFDEIDSNTPPEPELSNPELVAPAIAEERLTTALRELHARGEALAEDVSKLARPPRRTIAIGIAGLFLIGGAAWLLRRRRARRGRRPQRGLAGRIAAEIAKDVTMRALATTASVVATHVAEELMVPALRRRLAGNQPASRRSRKALG